MLVLSRKKNETIKLSEEITIVVVEIRGDKVRIGIDAPSHVPVHRGEIWAKIEKENPGQPVPAHGEQLTKVAKMAAALKGGK